MKVHNHWNGQCHENSESKLSAILGHSEHDCNSAIGGQGQLGCTWAVCHRSSTPSRRWWKTENALYYVPVLYWSELRICVRTKLNDVDTLSEMSLVKFPHLSVPRAGPNRPYYQCLWCLTSANGADASSSPGEGTESGQARDMRKKPPSPPKNYVQVPARSNAPCITC